MIGSSRCNELGAGHSHFRVAWTHVLLAPHTKKEESFNLHATHDILLHANAIMEVRPLTRRHPVPPLPSEVRPQSLFRGGTPLILRKHGPGLALQTCCPTSE